MTTTMTDTTALKALGFTRGDIQRTQREAKQAGLTVPELVRECVGETGYQVAITATPLPEEKRNGSATRDPVVVDSWNKLLFLICEPDRHGRMVWNARLILGDYAPFRYGPFETEKEARAMFKTLTKHLDGALWEMSHEAANHVTCSVNEEF